MKAVVAAFNQEKALVGAFSVITNLRKELFQALLLTCPAAHTGRGGEVEELEGGVDLQLVLGECLQAGDDDGLPRQLRLQLHARPRRRDLRDLRVRRAEVRDVARGDDETGGRPASRGQVPAELQAAGARAGRELRPRQQRGRGHRVLAHPVQDTPCNIAA